MSQDDFDPQCYEAYHQAWNELPQDEREEGVKTGAFNIFIWGFKEGWKRRGKGPATQAVLDMVRHYIKQLDGGVVGNLGRMIGAKKLDEFLEEWA